MKHSSRGLKSVLKSFLIKYLGQRVVELISLKGPFHRTIYRFHNDNNQDNQNL